MKNIWRNMAKHDTRYSYCFESYSHRRDIVSDNNSIEWVKQCKIVDRTESTVTMSMSKSSSKTALSIKKHGVKRK